MPVFFSALVLVYEDNGVGVTNENKLKIFSDGFTTGGSGLGLKLVKRMKFTVGLSLKTVHLVKVLNL